MLSSAHSDAEAAGWVHPGAGAGQNRRASRTASTDSGPAFPDAPAHRRHAPDRTSIMIPLRDENPSRTTPVVTWVLVAINVIVFVFELTLGPELRTFIFDWGLVPARLTLALRF